MIQTLPGDLVEVSKDGEQFRFAILTKKLLFGGNWCYVFHRSQNDSGTKGFNAFVDFIVPKRENRLLNISRKNDFSALSGSNLLKQQPLRGESNFRIFSWRDFSTSSVSLIRVTTSPTKQELAAPEYACIPADFACELVSRDWTPSQSRWIARVQPPSATNLISHRAPPPASCSHAAFAAAC